MDRSDIALLEEFIQELQPFRTITNMLCTNTNFSFNNYLPVKEYIGKWLEGDVDYKKTNQYRVIQELKNKMSNHF